MEAGADRIRGRPSRDVAGINVFLSYACGAVSLPFSLGEQPRHHCFRDHLWVFPSPWTARCNGEPEDINDRQRRVAATNEFLEKQHADTDSTLTSLEAKLHEGNPGNGKRAASGGPDNKIARDYDAAQKQYAALQTQLSQTRAVERLENTALGERLQLVSAASLPESPVFPDRWVFAFVGLGTGLLLGTGVLLISHYRRTAARGQRPLANNQIQMAGQPAPATLPAPRVVNFVIGSAWCP